MASANNKKTNKENHLSFWKLIKWGIMSRIIIGVRRLVPKVASVRNASIQKPLTSPNFLATKQNRSWPIRRTNEVRYLSSTVETKKTGKKDDSNIFLDNLGKIFLATIASIVGALIRSSYNTSNRNEVRDVLEDQAALDPVEIDELRIANSELTPEVFRKISNDLNDQFPHGSCSYLEFSKAVRRTMAKLKGDAFTIELGHLIDRVVSDMLKRSRKSEYDELPMMLWLVTVSLAVNSSVPDRIRILYEIMEREGEPVRVNQIVAIVGFLQDTCQLPPDTQVVPTDTKYPTQQWEKGTSTQLVPWEGNDNDLIDIDAFASILRSKSVCAWGECYHKKTFDSLA